MASSNRASSTLKMGQHTRLRDESSLGKLVGMELVDAVSGSSATGVRLVGCKVFQPYASKQFKCDKKAGVRCVLRPALSPARLDAARSLTLLTDTRHDRCPLLVSARLGRPCPPPSHQRLRKMPGSSRHLVLRRDDSSQSARSTRSRSCSPSFFLTASVWALSSWRPSASRSRGCSSTCMETQREWTFTGSSLLFVYDGARDLPNMGHNLHCFNRRVLASPSAGARKEKKSKQRLKLAATKALSREPFEVGGLSSAQREPGMGGALDKGRLGLEDVLNKVEGKLKEERFVSDVLPDVQLKMIDFAKTFRSRRVAIAAIAADASLALCQCL